MKIEKRLVLLILVFLQLPFIQAQQGYPYKPVPFHDVHITSGFLSDRLKAYKEGTLPTAIVQVRDSTARIRNFEIAAGLKKGKFEGVVWDDSDVYKVMEGMAYYLHSNKDPEIEKVMDYWISVMAKAQREDGYLNTFFILSQADDGLGRNLGRWSDMGRHEMYCAGHMIEAAIAYEKATGKKQFLETAIKFADHLLYNFGPYKRRWVPLHQEIELALVKLYHHTNDKKYLYFADWLFSERGRNREAGPMWDRGQESKAKDCQTDVPVKELTGAWGHAVRAMYTYSGMLDVGLGLSDSNYIGAVDRAWNDAISAKMYITGGVGARREGEAFGEKFELPNKEAYCETCSSVGMVLWNSRMNWLRGEAKYADVMERTLYNALFAGASLDGRKFFYTNPLEADGKHHRGEKYGIACCPSNMARFMPSVGNYLYSVKDDELLINLFAASDSKVKLNGTDVNVKQTTDYPYDGRVNITVSPATPVEATIKVRIPEWCKSYKLQLNGKNSTGQNKNGYVSFNRTWKQGDKISLVMDMPPVLIAANPKIENNIGKRALQRGPLVYCMEQIDNPGIDLEKVVLTASNKFTPVEGEGVLKGIKKLQTKSGKNTITFVPYFAWENRKSGKMLVWTNYSE